MRRKSIAGEVTLFSEVKRRERALKLNNTLPRLNEIIDWEIFRPLLSGIHKDSDRGRLAYDEIFLFKCLVLEELYNLSDEALEYQLCVRLDFQSFLGMNVASDIPDHSTFWNFRNALKEHQIIQKLFDTFKSYLQNQGLILQKRGCMMDATFVEVPRQRNTRSENQAIKESKSKEEVFPNKTKSSLCHKDTDASWAVKRNEKYFGYKNHIIADVGSKVITSYSVTSANVHDGKALPSLLPESQYEDEAFYADSAYHSKENIAILERKGYESHICEKGCRYVKLSDTQKESNTAKAKIRSRIEHIFGDMTNRRKGLKINVVGLARAEVKIGLMNIVYNMQRFLTLKSGE